MHQLIKLFICMILLTIGVTACTENQRAKNYGGSMTVDLPKGYRLVSASWKGEDLWYTVEPMPSFYAPHQSLMIEESSLGLKSGTVVFVETK
jgi:hypothetical protein